MAMEKQLIGLNTYLYTFGLRDRDKFEQKMKLMKKTGRVAEVFINNGYAFEYKKHRRM